MAIMNCQACDRLTSIATTVVVTDADITVTVTDPCCHVRDAKMLKAIGLSAYCELVSGAATYLPNTAGGNVPPTLSNDPTCGPQVPAPTMTLTVSSLEVVFTDDFSAVDNADQNTNIDVSVSPPFTWNV